MPQIHIVISIALFLINIVSTEVENLTSLNSFVILKNTQR